MQVPIDDILVKKRIRADLGDIASLAESMKKYGQLNPITLTEKNVLIAGERRLEAAKLLGWRTIDARIVEVQDDASPLEYEIEENLQRKDFTPQELALATKKLHRARHPHIFRWIWNWIRRVFRKLTNRGV